jgi:hypothetical protein
MWIRHLLLSLVLDRSYDSELLESLTNGEPNIFKVFFVSSFSKPQG